MTMRVKERLKRSKILNNAVVRLKWGEKRVSYGKENTDKTFFVIRRNAPDTGLFSFVTIHLGWIQYAIQKGYIPVIDMQNTKNTYITEEEVGKKNAWEFYFEQPFQYCLADISRSKNVILSRIDSPPEYPGHDMAKSEDAYQKWKALAEKYLIVKKDLRTGIDQLYLNMFQGKRTLGVLCRGTDYKNLKPSRHPIQPEIEDIMDKAAETADQYQCEYIYLATEDAEILQEFKRRFAEKLKFYDTVRYLDTGEENINLVGEKNEDRTPLQRGKDYLMEIGILAKCNCLVAGSVGGTYGALLMNEQYEYRFVYDLGLYP